MNSQRALQLLTIAFLVLGAVSLSVGLAADELLPAPLREWQQESTEEMSGSTLVVAGLLAVGCLVSVLVASVALLRLKKWGAWLHLSSMLVAFLTIPLFGPIIQHPATYIVDGLSMLVAGAIYGMAFFSGALSSGRQPNTESSASS